MSDTNNNFERFDEAMIQESMGNFSNDIQNTVGDVSLSSSAGQSRLLDQALTNSNLISSNPLLSSINNSLNTNQLNNINNGLTGNNPFNSFAFAAASAGRGGHSLGGQVEPTPMAPIAFGNLDAHAATQQQQQQQQLPQQSNVVELLKQLVQGNASTSTPENLTTALSSSTSAAPAGTSSLTNPLDQLSQPQQQLLSGKEWVALTIREGQG